MGNFIITSEPMARELADVNPSVIFPTLVLPGTPSAGLENASFTAPVAAMAMAGAATGICRAISTEVSTMMVPAFCAVPIVTDRAGKVRVFAPAVTMAVAVVQVTVA